jgi:hypothetical protein
MATTRLTTRLKCAAGSSTWSALAFDPGAPFEALVRGLIATGGFDAPGARWIAMRTLAEPDAAPLPGAGPRAARARQARWRPWRAYAALLLSENGTRRRA